MIACPDNSCIALKMLQFRVGLLFLYVILHVILSLALVFKPGSSLLKII